MRACVYVCVSVYKGQHFHGCRSVIVFVVIVVVFCCRIFCCRHKYCIIIFVLFRFSFRYVTWKISCRAFSTASGANFQVASFGFGFSVISNTAKQTKRKSSNNNNHSNNNKMFNKPGTQNFICVSLALFSQVPESTL